MKIHYKIVIPFTFLVVATTLITTFISISLISRTLGLRVRNQVEHVSEMISLSGFAVNPSILEKLKLILDAEIITYERDGQVIATTLSGSDEAGLLSVVQSRPVTQQIFEHGDMLVTREITYRGRPYMIAYRPLPGSRDTVVAFVVATADIAQAKSDVARTIATLAVLVILLMALFSQMVAQSITSPVHQLVEFTRRVAGGDRSGRADVGGGDEIRNLARAFNEMVQQLQESEGKLLRSETLAITGQLAAGVAHEIRNPLSSIKMQAQILRVKLKPDQKNQALLDAILREIDRVERVVSGLLDLTRPANLHLSAGRVNDLVEEALLLIEPQLRHRKITLARKLDSSLPPIMLDADQLKQALLNLILNASDAMPQGGTLVVATGPNEDGTAVRIEVCDNGIGIDPGIRDKVFQPFFSSKREGIGLGLVNAKSIVERHSGTLALMPGDGKGTRAIITLPVRAEDTRTGAAVTEK